MQEIGNAIKDKAQSENKMALETKDRKVENIVPAKDKSLDDMEIKNFK